jgi:hypothetical protein
MDHDGYYHPFSCTAHLVLLSYCNAPARVVQDSPQREEPLHCWRRSNEYVPPSDIWYRTQREEATGYHPHRPGIIAGGGVKLGFYRTSAATADSPRPVLQSLTCAALPLGLRPHCPTLPTTTAFIVCVCLPPRDEETIRKLGRDYGDEAGCLRYRKRQDRLSMRSRRVSAPTS